MTLIISAAVVILGLAAIAVWSGAELDLSEILSGVSTLAGVLLGIGVAGGRGRGAGAALALLALAGASTGCGAPCVAERAVVSALDVGLDAAEAAVGDAGGEDWSDALDASRGAVLLGQAAVDGCELARDGAGWQQWVGLALEAAAGLAAHFGGAAEGLGEIPPEPPAELRHALVVLRGELR